MRGCEAQELNGGCVHGRVLLLLLRRAVGARQCDV